MSAVREFQLRDVWPCHGSLHSFSTADGRRRYAHVGFSADGMGIYIVRIWPGAGRAAWTRRRVGPDFPIDPNSVRFVPEPADDPPNFLGAELCD